MRPGSNPDKLRPAAALLGDLAMRHGDIRTARLEYRQALLLNPR